LALHERGGALQTNTKARRPYIFTDVSYASQTTREIIMKRSATVQWRGGIKDGIGKISTQTGALKDVPYGFASRFENGAGTSPEELIGAAHAGCFTMAFAMMLTQHELTAESIETKATVTLEADSDGYSINHCHLEMTAKIPGASMETFTNLSTAAKNGCPVSKLISGHAQVTLDAKLLP